MRFRTTELAFYRAFASSGGRIHAKRMFVMGLNEFDWSDMSRATTVVGVAMLSWEVRWNPASPLGRLQWPA